MNQPLETLELKISKFLRAGVIVAGLIMLAGWVSDFDWQDKDLSLLTSYSPHPLTMNLELIYQQRDWGKALSYVGLLALILLPVTRVFLTAILFIKQKEFLMATIAACVLGGLFVSFTLGIVH